MDIVVVSQLFYLIKYFDFLLGYTNMISKIMTSNMIPKVKHKKLRLISCKFSNFTTKTPERHQLVSSDLTLSGFSILL